MRRAERLFRLVQFLRKAGAPKTADQIGAALEVSKRTVYRDIGHLQGSGLPIDGEAGVGYILRPGFDLPPMTFTAEQIEALALGAKLVRAMGDAELAIAAGEVMAKLEAVLPQDAAKHLTETPLYAFARGMVTSDKLPALRRAIREKIKVEVDYNRLDDVVTKRMLRPLALICFADVWLLTAWCELRQDFRNFRADRIADLTLCDERFEDEPGRALSDHYETRRFHF